MYQCYFTGIYERENFRDYYCENVKAIQRIVKLYGAKEIREILETTCLRNKVQRGYKINKILNEPITKQIEKTEENDTEEPVETEKKLTRSQKKKKLKIPNVPWGKSTNYFLRFGGSVYNRLFLFYNSFHFLCLTFRYRYYFRFFIYYGFRFFFLFCYW